MSQDDIIFCRKKYHKDNKTIVNDTTVTVEEKASQSLIKKDFVWQFPVQKILKTQD